MKMIHHPMFEIPPAVYRELFRSDESGGLVASLGTICSDTNLPPRSGSEATAD
ncbi:MAG: hypothetical protein O7C75_09180 [Verrucomicrobia bacterium]|nr:hypothetical protein [Verrucomicrobiota bacterium]